MKKTLQDKLTYLISIYDEYPMGAIDLLSDNKSSASRIVRRLTEKGLVRIQKTECKVKYMDVKNKRYKSYTKYIRRITPTKLMMGNNVLLPTQYNEGGMIEGESLNITKDENPQISTRRKYRSGTDWIIRCHRVIECMSVCCEANVDINPTSSLHSLREPLCQYDSVAYSCSEAKELFDSKFDYITQYRCCSLAITPGGTYAMYNLGTQLMEWSVVGESKVRDMAAELQRIKQPTKNHQEPSALIYTRDYTIASKIVKYSDKNQIRDKWLNQNSRTRNILTINQIYKSVYMVPMSREGVYLTEIMTYENWESLIKELMFKEEHIKAAGVSGADAFDYKSQTAYYEFVTGNLIKMTRLYYTLQRDTQIKCVVKCLPFQKEALYDLYGDKIIIQTYEISPIITRIRDYITQLREYEEYMRNTEEKN